MRNAARYAIGAAIGVAFTVIGRALQAAADIGRHVESLDDPLYMGNDELDEEWGIDLDPFGADESEFLFGLGDFQPPGWIE
jgi:hypothetical protein